MDKDQAMKVMAESHRETVNELKKSIEGHIKVKQVLARKLHDTRKENRHYRETLEYYAAPMTWVPDETGVSDADKYTNTIAREALEIDS